MPKNKILLSQLFLSLFFIGKSPISPGTIASALSIPLIYACYLFLNPIIFFLLTILIYLISVQLIKTTIEKPFDKSWIVIDEFIGMGITLLPLLYFHIFSLKYAIIGFIIFRFFDIVKPSLIRKVDNLETPSSVILDDVLAGICSLVFMYVITAII